MSKEFKVFFSWESDLSANKTKKLIEEIIFRAKEKLSGKIELIPDEATRNKFGSPEITDSIFQKIHECDLFIADVSIVGSYISPNEKDEDDAEENSFSNPNVLLELGYAAAVLGWERCICFANSYSGDISKLPFDLNHRRITDISYESTTRNNIIEKMSDIIVETVEEYADKPLLKQGFALHQVGGYNFLSNGFQPEIIPYNSYTFGEYDKKSKELEDEIKELISQISGMHIIKELTEATNFEEKQALSDVRLVERATASLSKVVSVSINKSDIEELLNNYVTEELCEDFFDVGDLKERVSFVPHSSPEYLGTNIQIVKYHKIQKLYSILRDLRLRDIYKYTFDDITIIPLAIKNISNEKDDNLSVYIKIVQGIPIQPTARVFNEEFASIDITNVGFEGMACEDGLVKEVFALPEDSSIQYDHSKNSPPEIPPHTYMPRTDVFGYSIEPDSTGEDYEAELQEYVEELYEGTENEYHFEIGTLRSNETLWLDKAILVKPVEGKIEISYSIKSNNTKGDNSGVLLYEE